MKNRARRSGRKCQAEAKLERKKEHKDLERQAITRKVLDELRAKLLDLSKKILFSITNINQQLAKSVSLI